MKPVSSISISALCDDRLVENLTAIMKDRISLRSSVKFKDADPEVKIHLDLKTQLGRNAYEVKNQPDMILICGGDIHGLYAGAGKFLRTCEYIDGRLICSMINGRFEPDCMFRGIHIADAMSWTSYHRMPDEKYRRYIEDLALYGYVDIIINYYMVGFPEEEQPSLVQKIKRRIGIIRGLGLKPGIFLPPNVTTSGIPEELLAQRLTVFGARVNSAASCKICPNTRGGIEHIMRFYEKAFEELRDCGLGSIVFWPYDPGGCGCEQCAPWGGNGFIKASAAVAKVAKKYFPEIKFVLSTWEFDAPESEGGEWAGLNDYLENGNDFIDIVMADNQRSCLDVNLCRYEIASKVPVVGFPDITMWGSSPWGGYGAAITCGYHWKRWNESTGVDPKRTRIRKYLYSGGAPYSEGIFTDTGAFLYSQFYWDRDAEFHDVMREYFNYECGSVHAGDVLRIADLIEYNHVRMGNGMGAVYAKAREAFALAEKVNRELPGWARKNWRWRLVYIRALLDENRYNQDKLDYENRKVDWTPEALAAYAELEEIFDYGPEQRFVLGVGASFDWVTGKDMSGAPPVDL